MQYNFLSPNNFQFVMDKTPILSDTVQQVISPGINLGFANIETPFVKIPTPGNISYGSLVLNFKVTENLENYLEVLNWMESIGKPDSFENYKNPENPSSDARLILLNSSKKSSVSIHYTDVIPESLSELQMDSTNVDVSYITATATFRFLRFYYQ